jgi:hypothetical protein
MHFLEWELRGSPSNKMSVTELQELNVALYWYWCLKVGGIFVLGYILAIIEPTFIAPEQGDGLACSGASKGERSAQSL